MHTPISDAIQAAKETSKSIMTIYYFQDSYLVRGWGGRGGESLFDSMCGHARACSTHMLVCMEAGEGGGSGGMPSPTKIFLDHFSCNLRQNFFLMTGR